MKTFVPAGLSASALALFVGQGAVAQQDMQGAMEEIEKFITICEEGDTLPGTLTCDAVQKAAQDPELIPQVLEMANQPAPQADGEAAQADSAPPAADAVEAAPEEGAAQQAAPEADTADMAEPAEEAAPEAEAAENAGPADEAAPEADAADMAEPAEEAAPEAEAAESAAPADEAAPEADEADMAEPAQEVDPDAEAAENAAPAEEAAPEAADEADMAEPAQEADPDADAAENAENADDMAPEADTADMAEPADEADTADMDEPAAQTEPAQDVAEDNAPAEPIAQDSQEQADALARQNDAAAAAAAADPDESAPAERIEETVEADEVRRSKEDFETSVTRAPSEAAAEDADDDDGDVAESRRRAATAAALLGLGAVALNEILGDDERVVTNSGDRVVVERNGQFRVLRNDDALLRRPGAEVQTDRFGDGSTRTVVRYEDGSRVETIRAADGRVLRRIRVMGDGEEVVLFDDTQEHEEVVVNELPQTEDRRRLNFREVETADLEAALAAEQGQSFDRTFSLNQVRNIDAVRVLVPEITVDTVNFRTNSAAVRPEEARALAALGNAMREAIERNPGEVFLIEGHTDAVGNYAYNLALSDRRAESVALALTEYFQVPPENMVLQGYGESDLLIETDDAERANRRVAVRRITPLLQSARR